LLHVLAAGRPVETCPTIGLNVKLVRKGGVQMKCWDIGGQAQYRSEVELNSRSALRNCLQFSGGGTHEVVTCVSVYSCIIFVMALLRSR